MLPNNKRMYNHFTYISNLYNIVRTTDLEPILYIKNILNDRKEIKAADIGCGAGRYDLLLFQHIDKLYLTCVDLNKSMIEKASSYLKDSGIIHFTTLVSDIEHLTLDENSLDCIFTFNAIHHFDVIKFLKKVVVFLKEDGFVFIYTRLQEQNARNIWGKYFPYFTEKEERLYELGEIKKWIESVDSVTIDSIEYFKFKRRSSLKELLEQANCKHYSTFCLYKSDEFKNAVRIFEETINRKFKNVDRIEWYDENIMLTLRVR